MEWQFERSLVCSGCGHPIDEGTDDEQKSAWIAERVTCWGCAAKERQQHADNRGDKRAPHGTRYRVRNRVNE